MAVYFDLVAVRAMLAELGVSVTCGAQVTKGLVDRISEPTEPGAVPSPVQGTRIVVTIETDSLTALAVGMPVFVNTTEFIAREMGRSGDGALTTVMLERKVT